MSNANFDTHYFQRLAAVRRYWLSEIECRHSNVSRSEEIARRAFDNTHISVLGFSLPADYERVRNEFGALEAPGAHEGISGQFPDSQEAYENSLWLRLSEEVNQLGLEPDTTDRAA